MSDVSQLTALIDPYLNPSAVAGISSQSFAATRKELGSLQQDAQTSLAVLGPLQAYNLKQITLISQTLADVATYRNSQTPTVWSKVQSDSAEYNNNLSSEQAIIISVLQSANMPYQVSSTGRITYH